MPVFDLLGFSRAQSAGLIEASTGSGTRHDRRHFPAHKARASLKRIRGSGGCRRLYYFPAHKARASLKLLIAVVGYFPYGIFPRTKRGPH